MQKNHESLAPKNNKSAHYGDTILVKSSWHSFNSAYLYSYNSLKLSFWYRLETQFIIVNNTNFWCLEAMNTFLDSLLEHPQHAHHGHLEATTCSMILHYLLLEWWPVIIAEECGVHASTVYALESNLLRYRTISKPLYWKIGWSFKLTKADKDALLQWLLCESWRQQEKIVYWLSYEQDVLIHWSTVSQLLKKNKWTWKQLQHISLNHSKSLHQAYHDDMHQFTADDLIFLDKSIFNEKTD